MNVESGEFAADVFLYPDETWTAHKGEWMRHGWYHFPEKTAPSTNAEMRLAVERAIESRKVRNGSSFLARHLDMSPPEDKARYGLFSARKRFRHGQIEGTGLTTSDVSAFVQRRESNPRLMLLANGREVEAPPAIAC